MTRRAFRLSGPRRLPEPEPEPARGQFYDTGFQMCRPWKACAGHETAQAVAFDPGIAREVHGATLQWADSLKHVHLSLVGEDRRLGLVDTERHMLLQAMFGRRDIRVLLDGVDVTDRCTRANDDLGFAEGHVYTGELRLADTVLEHTGGDRLLVRRFGHVVFMLTPRSGDY